MTSFKTAPPAAHIAAVGGATIPGVVGAPVPPPVTAGTALPAAASIPFARPRPGGMEAHHLRSLVVATGTAATLSAVLRSGAAGRAHTAMQAALGGVCLHGLHVESSEGSGLDTEAGGPRLCPPASTSTETACGNASGAWAVSAASRWSCPACGGFHGYGPCRRGRSTC